MSLLPKNEPKDFDITPKVLFVYGASMSGKTFFARKFPNPLILNTDGNVDKISTPAIKITNYEEFVNVLKELSTTNHTFETIIIDLLEDIETMLGDYIVQQFNKKSKTTITSIADIPFGGGFSEFKKLWKHMALAITQMPYNIIFISHSVEVTENNINVTRPAVSLKQLNVVQGRCDVVIRTIKIGNSYTITAESKRENYKLENIKNEKLKPILLEVTNLISK